MANTNYSKNDDEVIIEAKPTPKQKQQKFDAKEVFSMKNLPAFIAILSIFFSVFAMFLAFCNAGKAIAVFFIISAVFTFGSIGVLLTNCIMEKNFKPALNWLIVGFAILLLFL